MKRSAQETIRSLEMRVANLEKSAGKRLPKKVMVELENLLSPFQEDMTNYRFEIEVHQAKKLNYVAGMSEPENNYHVYKCLVEATVILSNLIKPSATAQNPHAKMDHLVAEAMKQADFVNLDGDQLIVLRPKGIKINQIGDPVIQRGSGRIEVFVEVVLYAVGYSDYFG